MNRTSLVLVVSALAACCGTVHAATESWIVPLSGNLSGFAGDSSFSYTLPLFNEQGGTRVLTGVQVTGSAMFGTSTQAFNGDIQPYAVNVTYSAGFTATLPSGSINAFQSDVSSQPALMPATFGSFNFLLEAPVVASVGNIAAFSALNGGSSVQTGTFTGGLMLPPISTLSWSTPSQLMGGSLSIVYTYNIVPAPASIVAILACGFAVQHRRRR